MVLRLVSLENGCGGKSYPRFEKCGVGDGTSESIRTYDGKYNNGLSTRLFHKRIVWSLREAVGRLPAVHQ